jgi:hypothetical protein
MMEKNCQSSTLKRFSNIFVKTKICKKIQNCKFQPCPNLYLSKGDALLLKELLKEFSKRLCQPRKWLIPHIKHNEIIFKDHYHVIHTILNKTSLKVTNLINQWLSKPQRF